jgi:hypothetical protein
MFLRRGISLLVREHLVLVDMRLIILCHIGDDVQRASLALAIPGGEVWVDRRVAPTRSGEDKTRVDRLKSPRHAVLVHLENLVHGRHVDCRLVRRRLLEHSFCLAELAKVLAEDPLEPDRDEHGNDHGAETEHVAKRQDVEIRRRSHAVE